MNKQHDNALRTASMALVLLVTAYAKAQVTPSPNTPATTHSSSVGPAHPTEPKAAPTSEVPNAPMWTPPPPEWTPQHPSVQPDSAPAVQSHSKFNRHRLQLSFFGGWALQSYNVATLTYSNLGVTTGTSNVDATFGGGVGGLFTYGFAFFEFLELTVSGGLQRSGIHIDNVDSFTNPPKGTFARGAILIGPQVNIPLYRFSDAHNEATVRLTVEGGLNIHGNPTLEADLSPVPGGTNLVLKYSTAVGWHGAPGIEIMTGGRDDAKLGFGFRLGYYAANYKLKSATENRAPLAKSNVARPFQNVSGGAIDVTLYFAAFL